MSSQPPIVPLAPYFKTAVELTEIVSALYDLVGSEILAREYRYNRAAFYSDLAAAIRFLIDEGVAPFSWSQENWLRWAEICEGRCIQLGTDPYYTMQLPPPRSEDPYLEYEQITNQVDHIVTFLLGVYKQEEDDLSSNKGGKITVAECAKLSQRFAAYVLPTYCWSIEKPTPEHPGQRVTWPWVKAVADELYKVFRQMGEPSVAGGWGPGGGEIPPISWPEP